jgi:23S rRNA G2069 N7-methylase RlmK/C1962 C5-methylase RlmI
MLVLAFNMSFADAASRLMRSGKMSSSMRALDPRPATLAFTLRRSRTFTARSSILKTRMVSFADGELSSDQQMTPNTKKSSLYTVVVHRNRQSIAFREGTPLVFGGSVASTFTEDWHNESHADAIDNIPIGSLVAVVVSRDSSSTPGKRNKDSRGKKRNVDSSERIDDEAVVHHSFKALDKDSTYRDMINQLQLIGYGVYNENSMYRVRILCHDTMHPGLTKEIRSIRKQIQRGDFQSENYDSCSTTLQLKLILERKIADATKTRLAMGLPSSGISDTYRLVNGEGDGLSGLAVDILGGKTAIVMSSAAWCEIHKETIWSVLEKSLREHPSYRELNIDIVWRNTPSRLKQDGYEVLHKSYEDDEDERAEISVIATESSVKYLTYPYSNGQKTGFYCDQRENRLRLAELCQNKRILDLCCYNGGFALNAMVRGRATSAIGVDSSQEAVDAATANASLNGLAEKDVSFARADIAAFMKSAIDANNEFDVVVLDPPKLAPSISSLDRASKKYHALNRDAINLISKSQGGLLLTCTCSAAMTQKDGGQYFLNVVNGAALSAKRRVTLLRVSGAAPCHTQSPASFPAGQYLTAALFHVGPSDM